MTDRKAINILWVEDSMEDMEICRHYMEKADYVPSVTQVETAEGFREKLDSGDWDIILCDYHLPGFSGPEALEILSTSGLEIPLIVVTGAVGEEAAVKTLLNGADNYVLKDNLIRLGTAIGQTLEKKDLIREKKRRRVPWTVPCSGCWRRGNFMRRSWIPRAHFSSLSTQRAAL